MAAKEKALAGLAGTAGTAGGTALGGPIGGLVGGGIGQAIGGLLGGQDNSAEDQLKYIQELYRQIQSPNFDYSSLTPEQKAVVGQLTPEVMQALEMTPAQTVQTPGEGRQAQLAALEQMQGLSKEGLSLTDKADLARVQNQAAAANKGRQDAILADLAARGMGGSGQELAARMASSQNAYNTQADQGLQVAAQARQRALDAMSQSGTLGGNLRSADYQQEAKNADIINQFNSANFKNRQDIANQNVANRNEAQGFNIRNAQDVSNQNVDTRNQFAENNLNRQNNLRQQTFGNDMAKVAGQAGQAQGIANQMNAGSAARQGNYQGIGEAVGTGFGSLFGSKKQEKK